MIWQTDGLPKQPLEEVLEPEMVKQYRIRRGKQCAYMPVFTEDRWLCACGAENDVGENCHACGLSPEPLTRQVLEQLRQDAALRLEEEEKNRHLYEAEAELSARKARRKKLLRKIGIGAVCVAGVAALAVGTWAFLRFGLPAVYYHRALSALQKQDIAQAYRLFVLADGHKDAEDYLRRFSTPVRSYTETTLYAEVAQVEDMLPEEIKTSAVHTYDSFGRLLTIKEETMQSDWQEAEQSAYANSYDEKGNCLVQENSFGKLVRQYDDHGTVRMEEHYTAEGTHDYSKVFVVDYDDEGRMVNSSEVCSDHVLVNYSYEQHLTFAYDDRGNLVKQTNVTNFPATSESNYEIIILWKYNDENLPVSMESDMVCPDDPVDNCREVNTWVYDDAGRLLRHEFSMEYPNNGLATYRTVRTCAYDARGNVISDITVGSFPNDRDRDYEETKTYTYNEDGKLTQQRTALQYVGKERDLFAGYDLVETYTYDRWGRLAEKVRVNERTDSDNSYTQTYAYTYGLDGSLRKTKEIYHSHDEDAEENYEAITQYNESGLPRLVEITYENRTVTREYTFGYYYYPEGVEIPQNDTVDLLKIG